MNLIRGKFMRRLKRECKDGGCTDGDPQQAQTKGKDCVDLVIQLAREAAESNNTLAVKQHPVHKELVHRWGSQHWAAHSESTSIVNRFPTAWLGRPASCTPWRYIPFHQWGGAKLETQYTELSKLYGR